ncbi:Dabb family protein [Pseudodesulfovibrio sp. JC047]|uniref:Dabb family protein n=1 Tax=Pseudodesulfovibrio sp. JC047 TaxID=2683199 RepID=UPI0013D758A9|nr:Dabb family protein [Pseudodesulfovibrio sp. JC047]NDV19619.1 Dabb family protein [Pseudodesulfovibrio sp. JC047]
MIRHIVMWTLKEEAEGATARENAIKLKKMLEALNGRIEGLRSLSVSYDILAADPECHLVLCSDHDDIDTLDLYQGHPEHQQCVAFVKKVAAGRKVLDCVFEG